MGRASNTPTKLLAYDLFEQTEGALAGKSANLGGTWAGAGDAADFTVIAAEDLARRTATSDADLYTGRYAVVGSEEPATVSVTATIPAGSHVAPGSPPTNASYIGVLARYVDPNNWLGALLYWANGGAIKVIQRAGGTVTELLPELTGALAGFGVTGKPRATLSAVNLTLFADSTGGWRVDADLGKGVKTASGRSAALGPGGALAKGKVGIYDAWTASEASSRSIEGLEVVAADPPAVVCYAGKSIEFNHQGVLREDEAGETWGQPDLPRGANFYLEPEGADGRINRIVLRMRRNDIAVEADDHVEDKHMVEIKVRERFLLPR